MVHNKRKKNSRQRGSFTHGWGEKKKHRGAGHRGGRGNAGSGKKGDAKKPSFWKDTEYFGKHGFASLNREKIQIINLSMLEQQKENFLNTKHASKSGDTIKVNLTALGIQKLLGAGTVITKFEITTDSASEKAISKIESAGGKVITESSVQNADSQTTDKKAPKSKKEAETEE